MLVSESIHTLLLINYLQSLYNAVKMQLKITDFELNASNITQMLRVMQRLIYLKVQKINVTYGLI